MSAKINKLEAEVRERGGGSWMVDRWVDYLHGSTFLDATHSVATVNLITPLVESLFGRAFRYLKGELGESYSLQSGHERWQLDDRWDHRYVWKHGRERRDIAKGIVQLAEAIDLARHLPVDQERTLSVLFAYRNKMSHCGVEWPDKELRAFADRIDSDGRADCFTRAKSGGKPWIFYMSREFTDHCLDKVDGIIEGVGACAPSGRAERRQCAC